MGDEAALIAALQNDIDDIKQELGLTPQGVYADIRVRLDVLESRIGSPFAQLVNVENPFFIGNGGVSISTGNGIPTENRLNGSLFLRTDGGSEGVYTRQGNVWFPVGSAGSDVALFGSNDDVTSKIVRFKTQDSGAGQSQSVILLSVDGYTVVDVIVTALAVNTIGNVFLHDHRSQWQRHVGSLTNIGTPDDIDKIAHGTCSVTTSQNSNNLTLNIVGTNTETMNWSITIQIQKTIEP